MEWEKLGRLGLLPRLRFPPPSLAKSDIAFFLFLALDLFLAFFERNYEIFFLVTFEGFFRFFFPGFCPSVTKSAK